MNTNTNQMNVVQMETNRKLAMDKLAIANLTRKN